MSEFFTYYHDKSTYETLIKIFSQQGKVHPHDRILAQFPEFGLLATEMIETTILYEGGDLTIPEKLYIALMAVSCYECDYLY